MKFKLLFTFFIFMFFTADTFAQTKFDYPKAKKVEQTDDYHGTKIADPFRGLENPDSPETRQWIEAENKLTFAYLNQIPEREKIKARLTTLWNYEKYSAPFKEGKRYFYFKNDGLQNQSVLYVADSIADKGRVLLDPNKLTADGTVAFSGMAVSEDGNVMAYGLSAAGSDWQEWRFRDVATGKDLPDVLKDIKFSGASWTKDGAGVFYSRYPKASDTTKLEDANYNQKLYFHKIGTAQSEDAMVYERPDDKEMGIGGSVTEDGVFLIMNIWKGTSPMNLVYYKHLKSKEATIHPLIMDFKAEYSFIGNDGRNFYFKTDKDAPRGKIVVADTMSKLGKWRDVIPQTDETIAGVSFVNNQFVVNYLKTGHNSNWYSPTC